MNSGATIFSSAMVGYVLRSSTRRSRLVKYPTMVPPAVPSRSSLETRLAVQRVHQHVERLPVRDVTEVVEGGLDRTLAR